MPKNVQYHGGAARATITEDQFKAAGQKNGDVTWKGRGDVQEVNNDAADWLIENEPGRFSEPGEANDEDSEGSPRAGGGGGSAGAAGTTGATGAGTSPTTGSGATQSSTGSKG